MGESADGGLIWNTDAVSYPVPAPEIDAQSLGDNLSSGTGLKLPEPDWQRDFLRGYRGEYRSVMEGPAPTAETVGRYTGQVVDSFKNFGLGMTGARSKNAARANWNAGNYGTAVLYGVQSFGGVGMTLLSGGTASTMRAGAAMTTGELAAARATYSNAVAADTASQRRVYLKEKFGRTGNVNLDINIRGGQKTATNFFLAQGVPEGAIPSYLVGAEI